MTTAIRCELCPTRDGVKPLATCRCTLKLLRHDPDRGFYARETETVVYDLCEDCRREAEEHGDLVPGAKVEVI